MVSNLGKRTKRVAGSLALAGFMLAGILPAGMGTASAQRRRTATRTSTNTVYVHGYQHGYSAGYIQGKSDWTTGAPREFQASKAYQERSSRYDTRLGQYPQYRDGYDLGFELGYTDGYFGRTRTLTVPYHAALLAARTANQRSGSQSDSQSSVADVPQSQPPYQSQEPPRRARGPVVIPNDTEIRLKLTSPIDTRTAHNGDQFTATVIAPGTYEDATVYGHISSLVHSGRVSGKTTVSLAFDRITLPDGRSARLDAQLIKIYESENVKRVDEEGKIESGSRTKDSEVRGGIGAAAGAIIGGLAGGGKGALIGILLGGAAGVGTVYVEGNKDLILDRGTEMLIQVEQSHRPRAQQ